jgi:hypothetical protein
MAALPSTAGAVTLLDFAKSLDPNGKTATVVELLAETNALLPDIPWLEGNLPTGHRTTVRTGLPTVVWRALYQGVPAGKSTRAQVDESCGMLEARCEVDVDLAALNGNSGMFRLQEAQAFLEAMNQEMIDAMLYNSPLTNPEKPYGLAPRYSALSGAATSRNVISAGGASNLTSIWMVCWGNDTVHGIFPKGSMAGIEHKDLGEIDAFDGSNNRYRALAEIWKWKCGLSVRDWRYAVRICNIDTAALVARTGTQALTAATNILYLMMDAMNTVPFMGKGKPVFYASRKVKSSLQKMAFDKSAATGALGIQPAANQFGNVKVGGADGELTFFGIPIRTVDGLSEAETAVA